MTVKQNFNPKNLSIYNTFFLFIYILILHAFCFITVDDSIKTSYALILVFTLSTFIFLLSLYSISNKLYIVCIILLFIVFFPFYIVISLFGRLSDSNITALFFTDINEGTSYLNTIPWFIYAEALIITLPLLLFLRLPLIKLKPKLSVLFLLISLFTIPISLITGKYKYDTYRSVYISHLRILTQIAEGYFLNKHNIYLQDQLINKPDTWTIDSSNPDRDFYVFIIGESVRKDFVGLYNEKFNNTPFLNSVPKIQFKNALSYGAYTVESLTHAFTETKNTNVNFSNNIVKLSKKANFQTEWISNQGSTGAHDNVIAAMAKQSDYHYFLTKGHFSSHKSDSELLPIFKQRIELDSTKKKVFFLHTIGSHPSPCDITNGKFQKFVASTEISCYIESIRQTDIFIRKVYEILKDQQKSFKIIYFSDHGLSIDKGTLLHRDDSKQNYEVPLVIIDSELNDNITVNAQRNLKDFISLFCELLKINISNNRYYNFISEDIDPNASNLYNNKNYNNLLENNQQLK